MWINNQCIGSLFINNCIDFYIWCYDNRSTDVWLLLSYSICANLLFRCSMFSRLRVWIQEAGYLKHTVIVKMLNLCLVLSLRTLRLQNVIKVLWCNLQNSSQSYSVNASVVVCILYLSYRPWATTVVHTCAVLFHRYHLCNIQLLS